jgi:hypothetical protein
LSYRSWSISTRAREATRQQADLRGEEINEDCRGFPATVDRHIRLPLVLISLTFIPPVVDDKRRVSYSEDKVPNLRPRCDGNYPLFLPSKDFPSSIRHDNFIGYDHNSCIDKHRGILILDGDYLHSSDHVGIVASSLSGATSSSLSKEVVGSHRTPFASRNDQINAELALGKTRTAYQSASIPAVIFCCDAIYKDYLF